MFVQLSRGVGVRILPSMMMKKTPWLVLLVLAGCGVSSNELVESSIGEINAQIDVACDCYAELTYPSRSACEDDLGFIGPSRERCVKDAYADDEASSQAHLECVLPLLEEYTECVNDRVTCSDLRELIPCNEDYDLGLRSCPEVPTNVQRDLDDCFR